MLSKTSWLWATMLTAKAHRKFRFRIRQMEETFFTKEPLRDVFGLYNFRLVLNKKTNFKTKRLSTNSSSS